MDTALRTNVPVELAPLPPPRVLQEQPFRYAPPFTLLHLLENFAVKHCVSTLATNGYPRFPVNPAVLALNQRICVSREDRTEHIGLQLERFPFSRNFPSPPVLHATNRLFFFSFWFRNNCRGYSVGLAYCRVNENRVFHVSASLLSGGLTSHPYRRVT